MLFTLIQVKGIFHLVFVKQNFNKMKREMIDTIIRMIENNTPKEVILKVTHVEEYLFNQIKVRYTF